MYSALVYYKAHNYMVRAILILAVTMLVACGTSLPEDTLESEAVRYVQNLKTERDLWYLFNPDPQPVIHGRRGSPQGSLVLYSKAYAGDRRQFGYVWLQQQGQSWQGKQATYKEVRLHGVKPDLQLAYDLHAIPQPNGSAVLVFGAALNPLVKSVEVAFVTGNIQRDALTDGMFAIIGPNVNGSDITNEIFKAVREVRALDAQGQVLQRFPISH